MSVIPSGGLINPTLAQWKPAAPGRRDRPLAPGWKLVVKPAAAPVSVTMSELQEGGESEPRALILDSAGRSVVVTLVVALDPAFFVHAEDTSLIFKVTPSPGTSFQIRDTMIRTKAEGTWTDVALLGEQATIIDRDELITLAVAPADRTALAKAALESIRTGNRLILRIQAPSQEVACAIGGFRFATATLPAEAVDSAKPGDVIAAASNSNQTPASPPVEEQTPAPSPVEEQTAASPPVEEQTAAPPPVEEQTAASSLLEEQTAASSPMEEQTAASSPMEEQTAASPPLEEQTAASSPMEEQTAASSPLDEQTAAPSPLEEQTAASSPLEEQTAASSPLEEQTAAPPPTEEQTAAPSPMDEQTAASPPVEEQTAAPPPMDEQTAASSPLEEQTAASSPLEEQTAAPPPTEEQTAAPSPMDEQTAASSPMEEQTAASSPLEEQTAASSPLEEQTAASSPLDEQTAAPPPLEEQTAVSSPLEEQTAVSSPVEEQTAASPPLEEQTAASSPLEEQTVAPSPVEEQTAVSSPMEEQTAALSPVEEQAAASSPLEERTAASPPTEEQTASSSSLEEQTPAPSPIEVIVNGMREQPDAMSWRAALVNLRKRQEYHLLADLLGYLDESPAAVDLPAHVVFEARGEAADALLSLRSPLRAISIFESLIGSASFERADAATRARLRDRLASALLRGGRSEEGLNLLREMSCESPDDWRLRFRLAKALAKVDALQALAEIEKLQALRPPQVSVVPLLANVLIALGRRQEALGHVLVTIGPKAPSGPLLYALVNAWCAVGPRIEWARALERCFPPSSAAVVEPSTSDDAFDALSARQPPRDRSATSPLVTVIMTAFNAEATVARAISSVLNQTHSNLRLLVVDDGSADGTRDILRNLARTDERIAIIESARNRGTYVAKNLALKIAWSDYYTFHDSDDWMHPERLKRHLKVMESDRSIRCSYSRWLRLDQRGSIYLTPRDNPASSFFRRDVIDEVGYFDSVRAGADSEFKWRLTRRLGVQALHTLTEILTIGFHRSGSLTTDGPCALDAFGYNSLRIAYAEAWLQWQHDSTAENRLYMPFPQDRRPFPAPAGLTISPSTDASSVGGRAEPCASATNQDPIVVDWPAAGKVGQNWGDKLNPPLVEWLSGRPAVNRKDPAAAGAKEVYQVIGSGLANSGRKIVWGSGFIKSDARCGRRPRSIKAVRGPLSRNLLRAQDLRCPEVYGDPALLLPLFYAPEIEAVYDVGIIQHFREAGLEPLPRLPVGTSVRLIDITGEIERVVEEILSCRHILSSSLHGIIAAHAYGVPATWIKFSDRALGDGFKFKDYWASMGRGDVEPVLVSRHAILDPGIGPASPGDVRVDLFNLIKACPFIDADRKQQLVARARARSDTGRPGNILRIHAGLKRADMMPAPAAGTESPQVAPGQAGSGGWFGVDSSVWALPGAELGDPGRAESAGRWFSVDSSVWALPAAELDDDGKFLGSPL